MELALITLLILAFLLLPISLVFIEIAYLDLEKERIRTDVDVLYQELLLLIDIEAFQEGQINFDIDVYQWIKRNFEEEYPNVVINSVSLESLQGKVELSLDVSIPYITLNNWLGITTFKHEVDICRKVIIPWEN